MQKITLTLLLSFLFITAFGQKKGGLTRTERKSLDSMLENDEFLKTMDDKPKSYFSINLGIGNSLYSVKNKAFNTTQNQSRIIFTPSVGYSDKSGLGISFTGYLYADSGITSFHQLGITPSYSYVKGKTADLDLSYTRFITKKDYTGNVSPIQNDFYGSVKLKKPWVRPGLALGYASGTSREVTYYDTVINGNRRIFRDTMTTKLTAFSLQGNLSHPFNFYHIITPDDGMTFTPEVMINAGSDNYVVSHKNPFLTRLNNKSKRFRNRRIESGNTPFQLQSLGINLDLNYSVGKFTFQPQVYFDYYLPATTDKRFTQIYSLMMGITL